MNNRLRKLRELRSLSQRDLASLSGVHISTINRLEKGTYTPRPQTLRKLSKGLGVPVEELLNEDGALQQHNNDEELRPLLEEALRMLSLMRAQPSTMAGAPLVNTEASNFYRNLILSLTPRETEMLRLIAFGRSNKEIAEELYVSIHTVASYVKRIMQKLGISSRTQAAACAFAFGLISPGELGEVILSRSGNQP